MKYLVFIAAVFVFAAQAHDVDKRYTSPSVEVPSNTYPWIVKIISDSSQSSGFLINERFVVTAAHAVDINTKRNCLSVHFLNYENTFSIRVAQVSLAPNYSHHKKTYNDIAILELAKQVREEEILLSVPSFDFTSYLCSELYGLSNIIGSGYAVKSRLYEAHLSWANKQDCDNSSSPYMLRLKYDGYAEGGDSGSPLYYLRNDSYHILGLQIQSSHCNNCENIYETIMHNVNFLQSAISVEQDSSDTEQSQIIWHSVECDTDTVIMLVIAGISTLVVSATIAIGCIVFYIRKVRVSNAT